MEGVMFNPVMYLITLSEEISITADEPDFFPSFFFWHHGNMTSKSLERDQC